MSNEVRTKILVEDLKVSFKTNDGKVQAVRGVSFELKEGETLAVVGESGSGKSVTNRAIMGILAKNSIIESGKIIYQGLDLTKIEEERFHEIRGKKIGMIFQDPLSSLNPIMKIGKQITEGILLNGDRLKNRYLRNIQKFKSEILNLKMEKKQLEKELKETELSTNAEKEEIKKKIDQITETLKEKEVKFKAIKTKEKAKLKEDFGIEKEKYNNEIAKLKTQLKEANDSERKEIKTKISDLKEKRNRIYKITRKEAYERAIKVMEEVGIYYPKRRFKQYPFQFSGGMRQRIVIAIALTMNPDVLICDEPTTALDVTIQAQILELINDLKKERNLSVIFITHDLGVVANMADRVAVMYAGQVVEKGTVEDIFYRPKHPYTWALLASMPDLESSKRLETIPGTPPNMLYPPKGCAFAKRNKYALKIDFKKEPPMFKVSDTHYAATWLLHEDAPKVELPSTIKNRIERMQKLNSEVIENE